MVTVRWASPVTPLRFFPVSSPKYQGRHYAGRHRVSGRRVRLPRAFSSSFVLPTTAAAALVVTATGATVAESAPSRSTSRASRPRWPAPSRPPTRRRSPTSPSVARPRACRPRPPGPRRGAAARHPHRQAQGRRRGRARAKAEREGKRWVKAIRTGRITSGFGWRWGKTHDGLDFGAPTGTPLYAMSKGTVILSDNVFSFGNKVEIRYWDGTVSWYGHLSRDVQTGDTVMPGDQVGLVGNTGHSFGSHLHLEIHPSGGDNPIDPYPWLAAHACRPADPTRPPPRPTSPTRGARRPLAPRPRLRASRAARSAARSA